MTGYVAEMNAAWHAFVACGRAAIRELRVVFAMLAGGAPLHARAPRRPRRPGERAHDPLTFYDTSSYGPRAIDAMVRVVGVDQLVHGSDRPVVEPRRRRPARRRAARARHPRPQPAAPARRRGVDATSTATSCAPSSPSSPPSPALAPPRPPRRPTSASTRSSCRDEHVSAWLICWMDDHDTGFHDHDVSSGAVAVVAGRASREERLRWAGRRTHASFGAGEVFDFTAADIHRVRHAGGAPAVTLHAYSPPLWRMGAYVVEPDGGCAATRSPTPRSCARWTKRSRPSAAPSG